MKATIIALTCAIAGIMCTTYVPQSEKPHAEYSQQPIDYRGIVCVQYNAEWNSQHRYPNIPGIKNYYIDIAKESQHKERCRIKTLPTLIFFKDGKEFKRIDGGIMFKIDVPVEQLKKQIDEAI